MSHNSAWLNLGPLFFLSFFFVLFFDILSCSLFSLFFCWKKIEASPNLTSINGCLLNMQHWLRMRSRWFGIYWPHSFSFLWTETKLRWIKMQQRIHEWGQYPVILTTETNLGFIVWAKREIFLARPTRKIPSGHEQPPCPHG